MTNRPGSRTRNKLHSHTRRYSVPTRGIPSSTGCISAERRRAPADVRTSLGMNELRGMSPQIGGRRRSIPREGVNTLPRGLTPIL